MTDLAVPEFDSVPFSPYFTLTASWYVTANQIGCGDSTAPEPSTSPQPKLKRERFTVQQIFGPAKEMSDDNQTQFLLLPMKHVDVDWSVACRAAAKSRQIGETAKMQERFARIVKGHNFGLEDGKKITGGQIFDEKLVTKPNGEASSSKAAKVGPKRFTAPKAPRKRKSGDSGPRPPATKKSKTIETLNAEEPPQAPVKTTIETSNMMATPEASIQGHIPTQEAKKPHREG